MIRKNLIKNFAVAGLLIFCLAGFANASTSKTEKALAKKSYKYKVGKTLSKAIKQFAKIAKIKVRVDWNALKETGVTRDTRVSLSGSPVKFKDLLEMILVVAQDEDSPLGWYINEKGTVVVTTQDSAIAYRTTGRESIASSKTKRADQEKTAFNGNINFDKTHLEDVIEYFRKASGANFHVNWAELEAVGIEKTTPVTLKLKKVRIAVALDLALSQVTTATDPLEKAYYVIDKGIVRISSGSDLNKTIRTKVFDAASMLQVIPNFRGPRVNLDSIKNSSDSSSSSSSGTDSGGSLFPDDDKDEEKDDRPSMKELREQQKKNLIDSLMNSIPSEMWKENGGVGTIKIFRNKLIITQSLLGWKLLERSGS